MYRSDFLLLCGTTDSKRPQAITEFSELLEDFEEAANCKVPMGALSEQMAKDKGISRASQDAFAASSYSKAVAAEAGVAPMGVYNHFQNKDGLLLAVMARSFDRLAEATAWPEGLQPEAAMRAVGHGYRRFALEHPVAYGLMFGVGTRLPEAVERIAEHQGAAFASIVDVVGAAQAAGTARSGDTQAIAMTIWAAVHGAIAIESAGSVPPGFDADAAYEAVLDLIERGLAP